MYVQRDHPLRSTKPVRLSIGLIVPSRFLRECISVLISRRALGSRASKGTSGLEVHLVSLSLTVLWADPLKRTPASKRTRLA